MKRAIILVAILLLPTVLAEDFPPQRQNSAFVGWQIEANEKIGEYRLSYPAVGDGEEINMAQNGPFAVVVFYTDSGEDIDQYIWLQEGLSNWGYITLVVEDNSIRFVDSKCPDHVCEHFGPASNEYDFPACLPAGVSVRIEAPVK